MSEQSIGETGPKRLQTPPPTTRGNRQEGVGDLQPGAGKGQPNSPLKRYLALAQSTWGEVGDGLQAVGRGGGKGGKFWEDLRPTRGTSGKGEESRGVGS